jgi:hypothetical protein
MKAVLIVSDWGAMWFLERASCAGGARASAKSRFASGYRKIMTLVTNIDFALARAPLAHAARPENYIAPQSDTIGAAFKREAW